MALKYEFVQVFDSGRLALSERPKIREIKRLQADGCDRVVTILAAQGDKARSIGTEVIAQGMRWDWVKVSTATGYSQAECLLLKNAIISIREALQKGESILIHCSAGKHRTGVLAYCVLRKGGMTHAESLHIISQMRPETAAELEGKYLQAAQELLAE